MAEVTKPIALNETFNTTESTPRNMADVLASGLANIANNVKPDGSDISISVPGMSANNVDGGFSELKQSLVNKVAFDNETLQEMYNTITSVGTSMVNLTANATYTLTNQATGGMSCGYMSKTSSGHVGFSFINYSSVSTWTGCITANGTVEYLSRLASKTDIDNLSVHTPISFTAKNKTGTSDCVIDTQNCYRHNNVVYFAMTLHSVSNTSDIEISLPSGKKFKQIGAIGTCGKGARWSVTGAQYVYVGESALSLNNITANTYYHLILALPLQ